MSTLLITYDYDAGELLQAAIRRAGGQVDWIEDLAGADEAFAASDPLVVVIDTGYLDFAAFIERARENRPWLRVFLLEEPGAPIYRSGLPVLPKPFDVAELAPLLVREEETARLDRDRRRLEHRTGQLVEQQRDLTRELEHSERLAAIGRIAASMAHEINNPLAVMQSASTYVRTVADQHNDQELLECAADIDLAVGRIATFVQHICGFARRERPILADTSLSGSVDIALRLAAPRARSRNVSVTSVSSSTVPVPHDPPRLAQAILNLLSNAIDAAASGGRHVEFGVFGHGDRVVVRVDDDGPGVPEEIRARLFEPFATTKPHGQGTGLGLAITRQIIQEHGGTVTLNSHPDHPGTRAELVLPMLDTAAHPLLVIDSDTLVQRALVAALRADGFVVESSATIEDAARAAKHLPRVVILDAHIEDPHDRTLVSRLRTLFPHARVMAIVDSADNLPPSVEGHLTKPWNRQELVSEVRRLCLSK